jgi:hypothetical protein
LNANRRDALFTRIRHRRLKDRDGERHDIRSEHYEQLDGTHDERVRVALLI